MPALVVESADKVFLTLAGSSQNVIESANLDGEIAISKDTDAAIFARSDLSCNGSGSLTITARGGHGLKSTDDLVITAGTYVISADKTAILGKDSVRIAGGTFQLDAGSDAIKANRTDKSGKGYIVIRDGDFQLSADNDGIQAATDLTIAGGTFNIVTADGHLATTNKPTEEFGFGTLPPGSARDDTRASTSTQPDMSFMMPPDFGSDGNFAPPDFPGETNFAPPDMDGQPMRPPELADNAASEATASASAKGIKAGANLTITAGTFTLDCADDALHADDTLTITGGQLTLSTGDDALHADNVLTIEGEPQINILASYEGAEAHEIYVRSGTVTLVASDDGFNAGGGESNFGPWQANATSSNTETENDETLARLQIDGGTLRIDAAGDGLDSNGDLIINGGDIIVNGPTNAGNGALDSGAESGGDLAIHGGTVLALGASGMAETFSSNSTQYSLATTFDTTYQPGEQLTIVDSDDKSRVYTYTFTKSGNSVVFSSPQLQGGHTYTVTAGAQEQSITLSAITNGESHGFGSGSGPGGANGDFTPPDMPGASRSGQRRPAGQGRRER